MLMLVKGYNNNNRYENFGQKKSRNSQVMNDSIPLVDISDISLMRKDEEIDADIQKNIGTVMKDVFRTYGFCYFINHGINQDIVDRCMATSLNYFKQVPDEVKSKIKQGLFPKMPFIGWVKLESETVNRSRPCDYKEGFVYHPMFDKMDVLPTEFLEVNKELFAKCLALAFRVCDALSAALGIDQAIFRESLKGVKSDTNLTCIRSSNYPPVLSDAVLKKDQIRCGEHSDYGTVSFLFQDDCGGLEVKSSNDEYISVPPIKGTIVAFIGDLMQRWTTDTLMATKHRVVVPNDVTVSNKARQSVGFFVHPDNDCLITCLDGSNKYEPITSGQHIDNMY